MEYNILCCNVGRRGRLMKDFRNYMANRGNVIATDNWSVAPALFLADRQYMVPKISASDYMSTLMDICKKEKVKAVTTFIDPEIEILSNNIELFRNHGILPLCPSPKTANLCFDKYKMFLHLRDKGVRTVLTYNSLNSFKEGLSHNEISFPVFVKPISGSGSVGAQRVNSMEELEILFAENKFDYIIQELMRGGDCDADVYVDCISHKPVMAFSKRKIETRIGGASKTISFKDPKLFNFIEEVCSVLELNGPCDMDFFYKDSEYYLSEINPRFGGAYLHAYGAGVNFLKCIINNIDGKENLNEIGNYEEGVLMLMYDDVVIVNERDLLRDYHD